MQYRVPMPKRATLGYWLSVGTLLLIGLLSIALPIALVVWLVLRVSPWT